MPTRPLVHATLEFGGQAWGGIASAVALMATADARTRSAVFVVSPGARSGVTRLRNGVFHLAVSVPGYTKAGQVYRSPARVRAGAIAARAFGESLKATFGERPFDLIVHNAELIGLVPDAFSRRRRAAYYAHGLWRQERPSESALHHLQDEIFHSSLPIAVASGAQAELLRERIGREVQIVPPPLQLLIEELQPLRVERARQSARTLTAAGRLVRQKGFDILLRALALVDPSSMSSCDLYVGHGAADHERTCRRLATAGRAVTARLHPWRSRHETLRAIATSAACAVPSRWEPLGIVAAEAIALGVPVIGSDVGGLAELLEDAGQLRVPCGVDGPTPDNLAAGIERVLNDTPKRRATPRLEAWAPERYRSALDGCIDSVAAAA